MQTTTTAMSSSSSGPILPVFSYEVTFPPGPHGLELEPVIISSERSIGCRVKGFFFSDEHEGIEKEYLESVIERGDILCSIDGVNVLSMSFDAILALMKSIRQKERIIVFKNVSASWNPTDARPKAVAIPRKKKSPPRQVVDSTVLSPTAVRSLAIQRPATGSPITSPAVTTNAAGNNDYRLTGEADDFVPPEMRMAMASLTSTVGSGLVTVGGYVAPVAATVGHAVAERVPRYSNQHMRRVVDNKNKLLHELSETCLQLGVYEEEHEFDKRLVADMQRKFEEMAFEVEQLQLDRDSKAAELKVLRDMTFSDKRGVDAEVSRLRDKLSAQQEVHRARLTDAEENIHSTYQENRGLRASLKQVHDELSSLASSSGDRQSMSSFADVGAADVVRESLHSIHSLRSALYVKLADAQEQSSDMQRLREDIEQRLLALQDEDRRSKAEIAVLERSLAAQQSNEAQELSALQGQLEHVNSLLSTEREQRIFAEEQLEELQLDKERLRREYEVSLQVARQSQSPPRVSSDGEAGGGGKEGDMHVLLDKVHEQVEEIFELREELRRAKAAQETSLLVRAQTQQQDVTRSELGAALVQVEQVTRDRDQMARTLTELMEESKRAASGSEDLRRECDSQRQSLTAELDHARTQLLRDRELRQGVTEQLQDTLTEKAALQSECTRLRDEIARVEAAAERTLGALKAGRGEDMRGVADRTQLLTEEALRLSEELRDLRCTLADKDVIMTSHETELMMLRASNQGLVGSRDSLADEVKTAQLNWEESERRLHGLQEEYGELVAAMEAAAAVEEQNAAIIDKLNEELARDKAAQQQLTHLAEELRRDKAALQEELIAGLKDLEFHRSEHTRLAAGLSSQSEDLAALVARIQQQAEEVVRLKEERLEQRLLVTAEREKLLADRDHAVEELQKENRVLVQTVSMLDKTNATLQDSNREVHKKLEAAETSLRDIEEYHDKLNSEFTRQQEQNTVLKDRLLQYEERDQLRKETASAEASLQLEKALEDIQALRVQLQRSEGEAADRALEVREKEAQFDELAQALAQTMKDADLRQTALQLEVEQKSRQVKELQTGTEELTARLQRLEEASRGHAALREELARANSDLQMSADRIQTLRDHAGELERLYSSSSAVGDELSREKARVVELLHKAERQEEAVARLREGARQLEERHLQLGDENLRLKEDVLERRREAFEKEVLLRAAETQLAELRAKASELDRLSGSLSLERQRAESTIRRLEDADKAAARLAEVNAQLDQRLRQADDDSRKLRDELLEKSKAVAEYGVRTRDLERKTAQAEAKVEELQGVLSAKNSVGEELVREQLKSSALSRQLEISETLCANLRESLEQSEARHRRLEQDVSEQQRLVTGKDLQLTELASLREELARMTSSKGAVVAELSEEQERVRQLTSSLSELEIILGTLREEQQVLERGNLMVEQDLAGLQQALTNSESKLRDAETKAAEFTTLRTELGKARNQSIELQSQLNLKGQGFTELLTQNESLGREIFGLKEAALLAERENLRLKEELLEKRQLVFDKEVVLSESMGEMTALRNKAQEIEQLRNSLEKEQSNVIDLTRRIDESNLLVISLKDANISLEKEITRLSGDLRDNQALLRDREAIVREGAVALSVLEATVETLRLEAAAASTHSAKALLEHAETRLVLTDELTGLRNALALSVAQGDELLAERASLVERLHHYEDTDKLLRNELARIGKDLEGSSAKVSALQEAAGELERLRGVDRNQALSKKLDASEEAFASIEQYHNELNAEFLKLRDANRTLEERNTALLDENYKLKEDVLERRKEVFEREVALRESEQRVERLATSAEEVRLLTTLRGDLETKIALLGQSLAAAESAVQEQSREFTQRLSEESSRVQEVIQTHKLEVLAKNDLLKENEAQLASLAKTAEELAVQVLSATEASRVSEAALQDSLKERDHLCESAARQQEEVSRLENTLTYFSHVLSQQILDDPTHGMADSLIEYLGATRDNKESLQLIDQKLPNMSISSKNLEIEQKLKTTMQKLTTLEGEYSAVKTERDELHTRTQDMLKLLRTQNDVLASAEEEERLALIQRQNLETYCAEAEAKALSAMESHIQFEKAATTTIQELQQRVQELTSLLTQTQEGHRVSFQDLADVHSQGDVLTPLRKFSRGGTVDSRSNLRGLQQMRAEILQDKAIAYWHDDLVHMSLNAQEALTLVFAETIIANNDLHHATSALLESTVAQNKLTSAVFSLLRSFKELSERLRGVHNLLLCAPWIAESLLEIDPIIAAHESVALRDLTLHVYDSNLNAVLKGTFGGVIDTIIVKSHQRGGNNRSSSLILGKKNVGANSGGGTHSLHQQQYSENNELSFISTDSNFWNVSEDDV